jgi:hypothetical protein
MNDVAQRKVSNCYYIPVIIPHHPLEIIGSMKVNLVLPRKVSNSSHVSAIIAQS